MAPFSDVRQMHLWYRSNTNKVLLHSESDCLPWRTARDERGVGRWRDDFINVSNGWVHKRGGNVVVLVVLVTEQYVIHYKR